MKWPIQILVGELERLQPLLRQRARLARGELLAGLDHDLAGLGVDQIVPRLEAVHALGDRTACASRRS